MSNEGVLICIGISVLVNPIVPLSMVNPAEFALYDITSAHMSQSYCSCQPRLQRANMCTLWRNAEVRRGELW